MSCMQEDEGQGKSGCLSTRIEYGDVPNTTLQCDEQKPNCWRCQKAGRQCPGYRSTNDVVFRSMNAIVEEKSRLRTSTSKGLLSPFSVTTSDSHVQPRVSPSTIELARRSSIKYDLPFKQRMSTDWNQQATCAFFHDYILEGVSEGRGGYLNFLPELYRERSETPYFTEALAAVSMANFANRASMEHLVHRARTSYGRALSLINCALDNKAEIKNDCLITSLFLIAKYENISGDKRTLFESHGAGQMELLRLRGQEQFRTLRGQDLYRLAHARQRLQDLAYRRRPTNILNAAPEAFNSNPHAAKLAELLFRATKLHSDIVQVTRQDYDDWALEALDILREMRQWSERPPPKMRFWSLLAFESSTTTDAESFGCYPKSIIVFTGLPAATGWTVLWCGQLMVLQTMLECRHGMDADQAAQSRLGSESNICQDLLDTVDNICAGAPFLLGEIDDHGALNTHARSKAVGAYFLTMSLHLAGSVTCLSPTQEAWISNRLLYIGNVFGIKQALVLRAYRESERAGRGRQALAKQ